MCRICFLYSFIQPVSVLNIRGTFGNTIKNGTNKSYKDKNQLTIRMDCELVFVVASEEPYGKRFKKHYVVNLNPLERELGKQ
jgi:hypothetical protein